MKGHWETGKEEEGGTLVEMVDWNIYHIFFPHMLLIAYSLYKFPGH